MLTLRLLTLEDAERIADYYQRNRAFHRPWSPLTPPDFATSAFQTERLHRYLDRQSRGEEFRFGIFTQAEPVQLIGNINLVAIEPAPFQNGRLGYSIDEHYRNQGIITHYLKQVIAFAFTDLQLHRLEANVMPRNRASRRVLEKCGFQEIGYSPQYLQIQGVWEDHILYMILAENS